MAEKLPEQGAPQDPWRIEDQLVTEDAEFHRERARGSWPSARGAAWIASQAATPGMQPVLSGLTPQYFSVSSSFLL
jgi:hypothetical protein